jgi:hypothetical protein
VKAVNSTYLHERLKQVNSFIDVRLNHYRTITTGLTAYFAAVEKYVVSTQIHSFAIALVAVTIILSFICGTFRPAIATVIVNIIPVVFILGVMGWGSIPLDITTVMIASIAIGIVVDDTIHIIWNYRYLKDKGHNSSESIQKAFGQVILPISITTLILVIGFASLLPARFVPTSYFGGLSALAVIIAGLADIILLPALILMFNKKDCNKRVNN